MIVLEDSNINEVQINNLYKLLKKYEEEFSGSALGAIRTKEALLEKDNTPIEILKDISYGPLTETYTYLYYGGYGGEDYSVDINIVDSVKEKLEANNVEEKNLNLEYYEKKIELKDIENQIDMIQEFSDPNSYEEELESLFEPYESNDLSSIKKSLEKLEPNKYEFQELNKLNYKIMNNVSITENEISKIDMNSKVFSMLNSKIQNNIQNIIENRSLITKEDQTLIDNFNKEYDSQEAKQKTKVPGLK